MKNIRIALKTWYLDEKISEKFNFKEQQNIALLLFHEKYAEDKLAGILFFQEILLPSGPPSFKEIVPEFKNLFNEEFIFDWNICDWLCVKVLGPLVTAEGRECAKIISKWKNGENLWLRRASVVTFVNLAKNGDSNFPGFTEMLLENCDSLVKSGERFAQTAVGWALRELWLSSPEKVSTFIKKNIDLFSSEGLRYATEKMDSDKKKLFRALRKRAHS